MPHEPAPGTLHTFIGSWAWLFPITYIVHVVEEYFADFPDWVSRVWGVESSMSRFLVWNAAAWLLMTLGTIIVVKTRSFRWLLVSCGTVVLINGLAHTVASLATRTYSPGLISGVVIWVPLGIFTLIRAAHRTNRLILFSGIAVGTVTHGIVMLITFGFQQIASR